MKNIFLQKLREIKKRRKTNLNERIATLLPKKIEGFNVVYIELKELIPYLMNDNLTNALAKFILDHDMQIKLEYKYCGDHFIAFKRL